MQNKKVYINSNLYPVLFRSGGDRLVAFYCSLKAAKQGKQRILPIIGGNKRKITHYNLLKRVTGFTKKTCIKYVKQLEALELCNFSKDGGFYLKGNNKIQNEYGSAFRVHIKIGKNLAETALSSYAVRIRALETKQKEQIHKKDSQRNLLAKVAQNSELELHEYNAWKRLSKNEDKLAKLDNYCNKVLLSRTGFAKYKDGSVDNASKGTYWKRRLVTAGFIRSRRRSRFIRDCSREQFLQFTLDNRRLNWYDGAIWEETVAEFTTTTFPFTAAIERPKKIVKEIEVYKKQQHLSFDMIDFWINGAGRV